jgi:hypothetical protein
MESTDRESNLMFVSQTRIIRLSVLKEIRHVDKILVPPREFVNCLREHIRIGHLNPFLNLDNFHHLGSLRH